MLHHFFIVLLFPSRSLRSHSAILKIPNELFYENELQVFADQWERETYCNWEYLPKKVRPQELFIYFVWFLGFFVPLSHPQSI